MTGAGGCEPRIEGIVLFIKKKKKTNRGQKGVNQGLKVLYNLEKINGGGSGWCE